MPAYYNEFDPNAAAWLRELIKQGHIAPGEVDERSIEDVRPDDLRGFTQCHFFAGIGGWSLALRMAGWPDDRPVWTGSCPCQPFSAAGKGAGFADERHLWPAFHWLIGQCEPPVVFGEQVASKDGLQWLDLVHADLEASGYAVGAADLCAAGVGAPHIRQRLYWVAYAENQRHERPGSAWNRGNGLANGSDADGLADADGRDASAERQQRGGEQRQQPEDGGVVRLADASCERRQQVAGSAPRHEETHGRAGRNGGRADGDNFAPGNGEDRYPGPVNGFWRDADWLACRDGKWRPVEPGAFPLAHGLPARVGRLRGYGNAIVPQVAEAFVMANV